MVLLSMPLTPLSSVKGEVQTTLYGLLVPEETENTLETTYVDHVDAYMTYSLVKMRTLFFVLSTEVMHVPFSPLCLLSATKYKDPLLVHFRLIRSLLSF